MNREFWPALCQLAEIYDEQGKTREDRLKEVVALFSGMPPMARRQVIESTLLLSAELKEIYAAVVKASHTLDRPGQWNIPPQS
jgi:hypothetical protein